MPDSVVHLSLKDMRQGQVGQYNIFMAKISWGIILFGRHERTEIFMRDHSTFWGSCGSWGVWKSQAIVRFDLVLFSSEVDFILTAIFLNFCERYEGGSSFLELFFLLLGEWVEADYVFDFDEVLALGEGLEWDIIDKDSLQLSVLENVRDILISQCIIERDSCNAVEKASPISETPSESILREYA